MFQLYYTYVLCLLFHKYHIKNIFHEDFLIIILYYFLKPGRSGLLKKIQTTEKYVEEAVCICVCELSCSVVSDAFVSPWTIARQAPLSMEFSRQESWSGLPFPPPGDPPDPSFPFSPHHWGGFLWQVWCLILRSSCEARTHKHSWDCTVLTALYHPHLHLVLLLWTPVHVSTYGSTSFLKMHNKPVCGCVKIHVITPCN